MDAGIPFSFIRIGGDRTEFPGDVRIGDELKRVTKIKEVAPSPSGDSLRMVQRSETTGPRGLAIVEEREFVYFDGHGAAAAPAPKLPAAVWKKPLDPSPVLLFRYSALRFNSHRIHYDRKYAMEVEGAPGLIVQSSLLGQLLIELCREHLPQKRLTADQPRQSPGRTRYRSDHALRRARRRRQIGDGLGARPSRRTGAVWRGEFFIARDCEER